MRTVLSALYDEGYPFATSGSSYKIVKTRSDLEHFDPKKSLLVLWGGGDISPSIYKEPVSKYTHASYVPSLRDQYEISLARGAMELGIPIVGVCRGAQLMTALAGGSLIQHVGYNHQREHNITFRGEKLKVSSLHHQMCRLKKVKHELLGYSVGVADVYIDGKGSIPDSDFSDDEVIETNKRRYFKEPEIFYLPNEKALCFQGHPEYCTPNDPYVKTSINLVKEYFPV